MVSANDRGEPVSPSYTAKPTFAFTSEIGSVVFDLATYPWPVDPRHSCAL
jgi:hypothetical protein